MKISIIGTGPVGTSLGKALLKAGHEVMFSSRDPQGERAQAVRTETGAQVGSVAETLAFSNIVAIAMDRNAIADLVRENAGVWADKIVIDLNNQRGPTPANFPNSVGQYIANLTQGRVVKAFNIIGAEHLQNPNFNGQKATMLIAGDDAEAKQIVGKLATDIGFETIDAGGLETSELLEKLAALWIHLAYNAGLGRNFAFKILKRE